MGSLSLIVVLAGCTGTTEPAADAAHDDHAEHGGKAKGKGGKGKSEKAPEPAALPAGAKVQFVEPTEGAKVKSPVTVKFAVEGMTLRPAGEIVHDLAGAL
jgi:hypothetical protein